MKKTICLILVFVYRLPFIVLAQTSVDLQVPGLSVAVVEDFKSKKARAYFRLDVELYPNSWNVYYSQVQRKTEPSFPGTAGVSPAMVSVVASGAAMQARRRPWFR